MNLAKKALTGIVISACTMATASPAFAQNFAVGGVANGSTHLVGAVSIGGVSCNANFAVTVSSCVAKITGVALSGGAPVCSILHANRLPWSLSVVPPPNPGGPSNVQISGISISSSVTCTGTVSGVLSAGGVLAFSGVLAPSCPFSTSGMTGSPPLTIVGPPTC